MARLVPVERRRFLVGIGALGIVALPAAALAQDRPAGTIRVMTYNFIRQATVHSHRVLDPRVEGRFLSDHLPAVAQITLAGRGNDAAP